MYKKLIYCCLITVLYATNCFAADTDTLHFHVVKNSADKKHVSMIPASGYTKNGKIIERYNPNSIIYQQNELIKKLNQEQTELDRLAELELQKEQEKESGTSIINNLFSKPNTDIIRNSTNRGVLEDLIELEKRAGRVKPVEK